jgi:hypothetical protein
MNLLNHVIHDRQASVTIAALKARNREMVAASTGNVAISYSA